jgi:type I restriction enzyme S subunit
MLTRNQAIEIAAKARRLLEDLYGARLRGVYLFGSAARDEADQDSDIDIAIVLDAIPDALEEIERTGPLFAGLTLESGIFVGRTFLSDAEFETGRFAIHRSVRREGIAV